MNQNTLNEWLEDLSFWAPIASGWKKAPLFKLSLPLQPKGFDGEVITELVSQTGKLGLPFEVVRIIDTSKPPYGLEYAWVFQSNEERSTYIHFCHDPIKKITLADVVIEKTEQIVKGLSNRDREGIADLRRYVLGNRKKDVTFAFERAPESNSHTAGSIRDRFVEFLSIVNCPRHFVTRVSPSNQQGRSVEWVEKKSHYIVLSSEHNKQLLRGERKVLDGTITRAMHNRRAHFRLLTSEKFTRKKGLKVWVKATWVGPKDWHDKSGNCYKIIDRKSSPTVLYLEKHGCTGTHNPTVTELVPPGEKPAGIS